LSLLAIDPIDHQSYRPSDLWSSFATFMPFGLFTGINILLE